MATVSLYSAASGLNALNTQLDVIANNLANVNTQGFKASRANFQDLLYEEKRLPGVENVIGDRSPTGLYVGLGVKVSGTQLDFSQGPMLTTERDLDVAIDGEGFFEVVVEDGLAESNIAYTRAGNFLKNNEGELVLANDSGYRLNTNVVVPDEATKVVVQEDGRVLADIPGQPDPEVLGQIQLATFINPEGLKQMGGNLFTESAASGPPIVGDPGDAGFGTLRGGFLEASNVEPTKELVELIRTQRAFEMNSQTIRAADETLRTVSQLRR
jgi:flagellar basal-body rod protein FlgG